MLTLIISSLYFILPAYVANMMPVFAAKIPFGRRAGDGGWREELFGKPISERWFGAHKTWRGFYAGFLGALIVLVAQAVLQKYGIFEEYRGLDYSGGADWAGWMSVAVTAGVILGYAVLFGVGAIFGDLVKSFLKRRLGIKPGGAWFPLDQLDFVIGAMLFLWPFVNLQGEIVAIVLVATPVLHFGANLIGYLVGLKKVWW